MKAAAVRLRLALAVLAWLAQALLPVAHAALMAAPPASHGAWCGDPGSAQLALSLLPADVRAALDDEGGTQAEQLANCSLLCALGSGPAPIPGVAPTEMLRAAGLEPPLADPVAPPGRPQAPKPPAHAPPLRA